MNLLYKDNKLYMYVTSTERITLLPFIYGAKLDTVSGSWYAPVGALLPILTVFPIIKPMNTKTKELLNYANNLLKDIKSQKDIIKSGEKITSEEFPFLMTHQVVCNNISKIRPRYAFFLDTGTR